jgi:hypothetical protein
MATKISGFYGVITRIKMVCRVGVCLQNTDWEEILENRFFIDETLVDIGAQSILGKHILVIDRI